MSEKLNLAGRTMERIQHIGSRILGIAKRQGNESSLSDEYREYTEREVPTAHVTFGNVGRPAPRPKAEPLTDRQITDREAVRAAVNLSQEA